MDYFPTVVAVLFGSIFGSFLNVLVYRLPREESVVTPGSHCPHCHKPIAPYDNIPVISWLMLKGRCRRCRKAISAGYPSVEATMGLLAGAIFWRWPEQWIWATGVTLACGALVALSLIDWDTTEIPDELSLGLLGMGLALSCVNPYFADASWPVALWWSFRGALVGLAMSWAIAALGEFILKKEALGFGDVKLLAAVGAWSGATGAFDCLMLGSFAGSIYGVYLIQTGKAERSDPIAFGPFLAAGAIFNFFKILPMGWPLL